jgi:hypothetical protein
MDGGRFGCSHRGLRDGRLAGREALSGFNVVAQRQARHPRTSRLASRHPPAISTVYLKTPITMRPQGNELPTATTKRRRSRMGRIVIEAWLRLSVCAIRLDLHEHCGPSFLAVEEQPAGLLE